jgi:hypothetical protein
MPAFTAFTGDKKWCIARSEVVDISIPSCLRSKDGLGSRGEDGVAGGKDNLRYREIRLGGCRYILLSHGMLYGSPSLPTLATRSSLACTRRQSKPGSCYQKMISEDPPSVVG